MSTLRVDNIKSRTGTVLTVPDGNTLAVTGIASVTGGVTNAGNFTNTGTLSVGGNATVTGTLDINGAANFNNPSGIVTTGTLNVGTLSQQNGTFTGTVTAAAFSGPLTGNVTGNTSGTAGGLSGTPNITVGTVTGTDATFSGNLTVQGTTTTIDSANLSVEDKNIGIGSVTTPTNTTANGGGLTLFGGADGDKEFKWVDSSSGPDYWSLTGGFLYAGQGLSTGKMLKEQVDINSTSLAGDGMIYLEEGMVHYRSGNLTGTTTTPNVKYNASTNLNDAMNTGESLTFTIVQATNSSSAYVPAIQIDGTTSGVSMYWVGGSAPSDGGSSGVDVYTFNVIKTGSSAYIVVANQTKTS